MTGAKPLPSPLEFNGRSKKKVAVRALTSITCLAAYFLAGGYSTFPRLLETTNFIWGV